MVWQYARISRSLTNSSECNRWSTKAASFVCVKYSLVFGWGTSAGQNHVKWKQNFVVRLRLIVEKCEHGKVQVSGEAAENGDQETDKSSRSARDCPKRFGNRRREHLLRTFPVQRNIWWQREGKFTVWSCSRYIMNLVLSLPILEFIVFDTYHRVRIVSVLWNVYGVYLIVGKMLRFDCVMKVNVLERSYGLDVVECLSRSLIYCYGRKCQWLCKRFFIHTVHKLCCTFKVTPKILSMLCYNLYNLSFYIICLLDVKVHCLS